MTSLQGCLADNNDTIHDKVSTSLVIYLLQTLTRAPTSGVPGFIFLPLYKQIPSPEIDKPNSASLLVG